VQSAGIVTQQAYQLPPEKYQAAIEFNRQVDALHFVAAAWAILVIALLIRYRAGIRLRHWGAFSAPVILAIPWLASFPFSAWRHLLGLRYGLSVENWPAWVWDWLKAGMLATSGGALLAIAVFALARRSPRRWWIYAWAVAVIFMLALTYATPLVVDPLFHRFAPLASSHPALIGPIELVGQRAGQYVPTSRLYEMQASEKTRTLNAYVTGFGPAKRVVIWDNTIRRLTPPQIQTVFAHELGHYALHHIPRSLALASAALFAVFWLVRGLTPDYVSLPRLLLIVTLFGFLSEPVVNTYSRWQEREADTYELNLMRGLIPNAGANSAQVDQIMAEIALDDPAPNRFVKFWLYDHPPADERMRFALAWDNAPPVAK